MTTGFRSPRRLSQAMVTVLIAVFIAGNPQPALAAGGAHVVDDSEVETPGSCHVETSVKRVADQSGVVTVSPACTPGSIADLEIGMGAIYSRDANGENLAIGSSLKWQFRPSSSGPGIAIDASALWGSADKRIEGVSLIVPLTLTIGKGFTANLNAGAVWSRDDIGLTGFFGGQMVWQNRTNLGIMIEAFGRTQGDPSAQGGVRWNPDANIDIDLLVSHEFNGAAHEDVTIGLTRRF
jgi:hypothetical protein